MRHCQAYVERGMPGVAVLAWSGNKWYIGIAMANEFYRGKQTPRSLRSLLSRIARRKRLFLAVAAGILLMGFALFGNRGVLQRVRLEERKARMETNIREAQDENRRLQAQSKALDGDKKAIEKVAREDHGMHRKGETVYRVKKKDD
jgi:cell division protein FtsB